MEKKVFDWLLNGPPWLRYAVESQLLDLKPDLQPVLNDPTIKEIIERLKDKRRGLPAIGTGYWSADEYENPYWDLYFLADLGLKIPNLGLTKEIEDFLKSQSERGTFITEPGMDPNYHCKSAIIVSSIARMGLHNDPHVKKYIELILSSQRLDGGWYCNPNHDIGAPLQYEPSCPQENLNVLLLLGQYPQYRTNPRFNGVIDQLLRHWELRGTGIQIVYFGVGRRYQSLHYPATRYGLLRVMDAISLFPYSLNKASFQSMLNFVYQKAKEGKYTAETQSPYTELEPTGQPSRILTFLINRIEKRVDRKYKVQR
jgi:hypothetical protein